MTLECILDLIDVLDNLRPTCSSEVWKRVSWIVLSGELELALTDVVEVDAALDEGFDLGEDRTCVEVPRLPTLFYNLLGSLLEDLLPDLPALLALLQVLHALENVPIKHVGLINNVDTSIDNLI
jgi:hypothetical protein